MRYEQWQNILKIHLIYKKLFSRAPHIICSNHWTQTLMVKVQHSSQRGHCGPLDQLTPAQSRVRCYRCLSGASVFSLESGCSCAVSASFSFKGNIHARAAPAVPSPLWREKQRKVAQTKAQQPVKVVRTYKGTKAKFRNWGRRRKMKLDSYRWTNRLQVAVWKANLLSA